MNKSYLIAMSVGAMLTAGCSHPTQQLYTPNPPTVKSSAPLSAPPAPVAPPKPEWVATFKTALGVIGGTKDHAVAELGPPSQVIDQGGSLKYDYTIGDNTLHVFFKDELFNPFGPKPSEQQEEERPVIAIGLNLSDNSVDTAEDIWQDLGGTAKPKTLIYPSASLADYWDNPQKLQTGSAPGFPFRLQGKLPKGPILVMEGANMQCPLVSQKTFSTQANSYVYGQPSINSDFRWGDTKVIYLYAGDQAELTWLMVHYDTSILTP